MPEAIGPKSNGDPTTRRLTLDFLLAVSFPAMPADGALVASLRNAGIPYQCVPGRKERVVDVETPRSLDRLSHRQRRNAARLARRAEREHGPLRLRSFGSDESVLRGFDLFLTLEASGWKGDWTTLSALAYRRADRTFYEGVLTDFAAHGAARVDVLFAGMSPVSAQLAVRSGEAWHLLKIGYDEAFRRVGPGAVLFNLFLEEVAADPSVRRVHLGTAPEWSDRWHLDEVQRVDLQLFCPTRRGRRLLAEARHDDRDPAAHGREGPRLAS